MPRKKKMDTSIWSYLFLFAGAILLIFQLAMLVISPMFNLIFAHLYTNIIINTIMFVCFTCGFMMGHGRRWLKWVGTLIAFCIVVFIGFQASDNPSNISISPQKDNRLIYQSNAKDSSIYFYEQVAFLFAKPVDMDPIPYQKLMKIEWPDDQLAVVTYRDKAKMVTIQTYQYDKDFVALSRKQLKAYSTGLYRRRGVGYSYLLSWMNDNQAKTAAWNEVISVYYVHKIQNRHGLWMLDQPNGKQWLLVQRQRKNKTKPDFLIYLIDMNYTQILPMEK